MSGSSFEIKPIDYIAFAFEANGNLTLYRKTDSSVIMIAHDHGFEHITRLEGYPEYRSTPLTTVPNLSLGSRTSLSKKS
ncbi:hypothetical protein PAESOLCIP111_06465 [Paenibacillus solanacearum]|uniref:Uncharacterized protein n=1 Tax=Paenibacillus solanacearum TaxID=2048548 RepID=A0A916K800_9BACL|nr:hypothetical protein PAESOLCIP111_06465 [Paenibacillus solanacearum]